MVQKLNIEQFLSLAKEHPVLDVRSPGEYKHAHIPDAISFPLFTDEERKVVGTTYKQDSRESAIKIGLEYFGPKLRKMVEDAEGIVEKRKSLGNEEDTESLKTVLVYCWRGGMRSAAIAWLLDLYGFKVYTLTGGYKKFRRYVLETFEQPLMLNVLGGYTGSGKSELLQVLKEKGETIVDLEDIAKHKGSAFGNIGMPDQPSQEMFENLLALELRNKSASVIWIEDESQRIGHVNLPAELWATMRRSLLYFIDVPFEERLIHIVEEYGILDKKRMVDAIGRISEKLGGLNARLAKEYLIEGNITESFRILLRYYDKFYLKAMHNRGDLQSLLRSIECRKVGAENVNMLLAKATANKMKA